MNNEANNLNGETKMTSETKKEIKKILKDHGVKGFRKAKMKRPVYYIGRQCQLISHTWTANSLMDSLKALGFAIQGESTLRQLADKGMLDVVSITPA